MTEGKITVVSNIGTVLFIDIVASHTMETASLHLCGESTCKPLWSTVACSVDKREREWERERDRWTVERE